MDLKGIMLSEISQTEKEKHCMLSLTCGIYKIKQMNKYEKKRNKLTDIENKLADAGGRGVVGGTKQMKGIKRYKPLGIK